VRRAPRTVSTATIPAKLAMPGISSQGTPTASTASRATLAIGVSWVVEPDGLAGNRAISGGLGRCRVHPHPVGGVRAAEPQANQPVSVCVVSAESTEVPDSG